MSRWQPCNLGNNGENTHRGPDQRAESLSLWYDGHVLPIRAYMYEGYCFLTNTGRRHICTICRSSCHLLTEIQSSLRGNVLGCAVSTSWTNWGRRNATYAPPTLAPTQVTTHVLCFCQVGERYNGNSRCHRRSERSSCI